MGAIAPSSDELAEAMTAQLELSRAEVVAEFGAGSGAFTSRILRRMPPGSLFFAVESNPVMARHLRKRYPQVRLIEDSVENLPRILGHLGRDKIDCIISSLPWAFFDPPQQDRLLTRIVASLPPGGLFVTYAYVHGAMLPSGIRFRKELVRRFALVHRSEPVFRNIPPAFVYRCVK